MPWEFPNKNFGNLPKGWDQGISPEIIRGNNGIGAKLQEKLDHLV